MKPTTHAADRGDLAALQRWMHAVVTHPGGVETGAASDEAQREMAADSIGDVVPPSERQSSAERMAVYARSYWARLVECLQEDFPAVRRAVGDDAFAQLAVGYLIEQPSASYTLGRLGEQFPAYLSATAPVGEDWMQSVVELAQLERAVTEVFDLSGGETRGYLSLDALRDLAPEDYASLRLNVLPTVRLLRFEHDVDRWFTALRAEGEVPDCERSATYLALSRRDFTVRRHRLTRGEFLLLESLTAGKSLGAAIESVQADSNSTDVPLSAEMLTRCFADWTRAGIFGAMRGA